jgi:hypothetical protein
MASPSSSSAASFVSFAAAPTDPTSHGRASRKSQESADILRFLSFLARILLRVPQAAGSRNTRFRNGKGGWPMEMQQSRIATALVALAGLWLMAAPFVLGYANADGMRARSDDLLFGAGILIVSGYRLLKAPDATWMSVVTAVMGFWVFLSPFYIGYHSVTVANWNDHIVGIFVIIVSAWAALATRRLHQHAA